MRALIIFALAGVALMIAQRNGVDLERLGYRIGEALRWPIAFAAICFGVKAAIGLKK